MVFGMGNFPLKDCIKTLETFVKPAPECFDKVRHLTDEEYKRIIACLPEKQPAITSMTANVKALSKLSDEERTSTLNTYCEIINSIVEKQTEIGRLDVSTK